MFDTLEAGSGVPAASHDCEAAPVPLERLETEICELAGHLTAATCRFLVLLGDFDARRGWASWEMNSCAQWLSWKCQMSSGTASSRNGRTANPEPQNGSRSTNPKTGTSG